MAQNETKRTQSVYTIEFDECSMFVFLIEHRPDGSRHIKMDDSVSRVVNYCKEHGIEASIAA